MKRVKAVVLVAGRYDIPAIPRHEDDLKDWYTSVSVLHQVPLECKLRSLYKRSFVVAPEDHLFAVESKVRKKHGKVHFYGKSCPGPNDCQSHILTLPSRFSDEKKAIKLMERAFPEIQEFIASKLS